MKLVEHFDRIKKMNRMIKLGSTGTPAEFAGFLGISQSHLFRCLHELKQYGMDIRYCRAIKTYYYGNDNELTINYSLKLISGAKAKEIIGGCYLLKYYTEVHKEAQILTYMKFANKEIGLLINFNVNILKDGIRRYRY